MSNIKFPVAEDLTIREMIENKASKGELYNSLEPCLKCSTTMLSITILTSKGVVEHFSCPSCHERDIRPLAME